MNYFNVLVGGLLSTTLAMSFVGAHANTLALDPEEMRVVKISGEFSDVSNQFSAKIALFNKALNNSDSDKMREKVTLEHGQLLWEYAVGQAKMTKNFDDRPLYWARLAGRISIKQLALPKKHINALLANWEDSSRGLSDINFDDTASISRVFLTGFDPFLLDRNIEQSNPSGVTALMLDGKTINYQGKKFQIETVMIPVRFDDFDQGLIERILAPLMQPNQRVNLMTTVSMGREDFDLERFPGKRRSATISGNRNVITGASATNPLVPLLDGKLHQGAEFVEFSLPVKLMQQAKGAYKINDNHNVSTLAKGKISPKTLAELSDQVSVTGSGGSYLSNEISYRSVALRDKLGSNIAVGHIHIPRIKSFEPQVNQKIVAQITEMLKQASTGF